MLIEKDIQYMLNQLGQGNVINLALEGFDIVVRFLDSESKLSLTTLVYHGDNYIPLSVRRCLSHKADISHPSIRTYLSIDEQHFQIKLNYLGQAYSLTRKDFKELLEEFRIIAEKWRSYLDEHDKHDLVHVRVK